MTPADIQKCFEDPDGTYRFARWLRPIVPVVFGVDDKTLEVVKGAIEAVVHLAGHRIGETDPEMGANLMIFFVSDWAELTATRDLTDLVPELAVQVPNLIEQGANQYRLFRFEADGSIRAAFVFLRLDQGLAEMAAEDLALGQAVQVILLWARQAFAQKSPLAMADGVAVLRPDIAALIRAAYDPVMPGSAQDASHALRLFARMGSPT